MVNEGKGVMRRPNQFWTSTHCFDQIASQKFDPTTKNWSKDWSRVIHPNQQNPKDWEMNRYGIFIKKDMIYISVIFAWVD